MDKQGNNFDGINWARHIGFLFLCSLFLFCSSCEQDILTCEEGDGPIIRKVKEVSNFKQVELKGSGTVRVSKDSVYTLSVSAQENIHDLLDIYVDGETLVLDREECFKNHKDIRYEVSMPELSGVEISGSGSLSTKDDFEANETSIRVSGSGEIQMPVYSEQIHSKISGSGDITLFGEANNHQIEITGSGGMFAYGLTVGECEIEISGSGNSYVNVKDRLDVKISGSGNVRYRGNPSVNTRITGSGNVKKDQ